MNGAPSLEGLYRKPLEEGRIELRYFRADMVAETLGTGDFDGNGRVDFTDFLLFAQAFGTNDVTFDLTGDGTVGFEDFLIFAAAFGKPV